MAIKVFRLPDPGEGLVEADIVTWRVATGDQVQVNDILLEIETSKSLVELPSPYAGVVSELLVSEGATVDVGAPIITIDDGRVDPVPASVANPAVAEGEPAPERADVERVANLVGYGAKDAGTRRRPRKSAADPDAGRQAAREQASATFATHDPVSRRADHREPLQPSGHEAQGDPLPAPGPAAGAPAPHLAGAVLAKPPVRKLARDLGVDLATVGGSGDGGVITRADVEAAAASLAAAVPAAAEPAAGLGPAGRPDGSADVRIPIKGVRKATAAAMVESAFTAPHVTVWVETDVTATVELVTAIKARREFDGVKVSPLLVVAKAALIALRRHPELNSAWDAEAQEIVLKGSVNLGIAAATPRGLLVPNIKGADQLSLLELAQALGDLVATARAGKAQPADLGGGSFTITNIGVFGIDGGLPILNPGEAAILAVGQIARKPWVVGIGADERIEPRSVLTLAVSFDHRLADGQQGSLFLADIASILTNPGLGLVLG